jgi:hypothetical protein
MTRLSGSALLAALLPLSLPLSLALSACAEGPLCKSARRGDLEGLKAAASAGDAEKKSALFCAVDSGNAEAVRALLAAGAPISMFALARARDGQPEILALLRQEQARRDASAAAAKAQAPAAVPAEEPSDIDKTSYSEPARPADAALVVGVDAFGPHDADAVLAHLTALGCPASRARELKGAAATRLAVLKALDGALPPLVSSASAVTVYFSGRSAAGANGAAYLLLADSDPAYLEDSALPLARVYARLSSLGARSATLVLETAVPGALPPPPPGVTVLAAAAGGGAGAYPEKRHGLFTYWLLRALADGKRSLTGAFPSAAARVSEDSAKLGAPQKPVLLGADAAR